MGHKGYYGQYTGNAKWSKNHADTKVTKSNYKASERDDAAHIDYLKRDINYDNKHGHSDSSMTSDEKHISKLAGDVKYDEKKEGMSRYSSPANNVSYGDKSGITGYIGEERKDLMKYNPVDDRAGMSKYKKEGMSRHTSEHSTEEYMSRKDAAIKKSQGEDGMSRQKYGGNKGDESRSKRDY